MTPALRVFFYLPYLLLAAFAGAVAALLQIAVALGMVLGSMAAARWILLHRTLRPLADRCRNRRSGVADEPGDAGLGGRRIAAGHRRAGRVVYRADERAATAPRASVDACRASHCGAEFQ